MRALLILAFLPACTGSGTQEVADYTLNIIPVVSSNVDPFANLSRLDVVIEPVVGDPITTSLDSFESGTNPKISGLAALDGGTVSLEGYANGDLVSFGRSEPIELVHGELEARVLFSQIGKVGFLENLPTAAWASALAPTGNGRFLMFGGTSAGYPDGTGSSTFNTVSALDVAPPTEDFTFFEVGEMPDLSDEAVGRVGHTATLLTVNGDQKGLILVTGGGATTTYYDDVSSEAFLWDPDTNTVAAELEMRKARMLHGAIEDKAGNVVLYGGLGYAGRGYISFETSIEIYSPATGEFSTATGKPEGPLYAAASASLGSPGTLICGGVEFLDSGNWLSSDSCDVVSTSGAVTTTTSLPAPTAHGAMASLPDGQALFTGGLDTGSDELDQLGAFPALQTAWVFDGSAWRELDEKMHVPRAGHRATPLPDGRVLIIGGASGTDYGFYPSGTYALACAEIYDPETEKFTEVDDCDEDSESASLPTRMSLPSIAADDRYGVLVAGGLYPGSGKSRSSESAALFVSCPDPDKC